MFNKYQLARIHTKRVAKTPKKPETICEKTSQFLNTQINVERLKTYDEFKDSIVWQFIPLVPKATHKITMPEMSKFITDMDVHIVTQNNVFQEKWNKEKMDLADVSSVPKCSGLIFDISAFVRPLILMALITKVDSIWTFIFLSSPFGAANLVLTNVAYEKAFTYKRWKQFMTDNITKL